MSTVNNGPLKTDILNEDQDAVVGLITLAAYKPLNASVSTEALKTLLAERMAKEDAYTVAQNAYRAAADARNQAQHALHNRVLQMRSAVIAQFGPDSDEVVAVGLHKKSERRRPRPRGVTLQPAFSGAV